ncbi:MAG: DUF3126 family protein [Alphaproteobacteria bacterium]|nr:DUF3126 family protein [Alphaproteobacteria bacterium]
MTWNNDEVQKLQGYFQRTFGLKTLQVRTRPKAADSLELLKDGEFLGTIYKDDEDGDISYNLTMSILDIDLEEAA